MELTKEWMLECAFGYTSVETAIDEICKAVQLDRQRVRDEAIAEVKRDHFRIGEDVEVAERPGTWVKGIVCGVQSRGGMFVVGQIPDHVRRPPKTRPMTREEKIEALLKRFTPQQVCEGIGTDDGIDAYCELSKIETEVIDEHHS